MWSEYLEKSRNWTFRLYTMEEVCEILRINRTAFYALKKEGLFKAMLRKLEYCDWRVGGMGRAYFTDRQVLEAIVHMHHDAELKEIEYLKKHISEVPDDAIYKERRKIKKNRTKKKRNNSGRCKTKLKGGIRPNRKGEWIEAPSAYTPRSGESG